MKQKDLQILKLFVQNENSLIKNKKETFSDKIYRRVLFRTIWDDEHMMSLSYNKNLVNVSNDFQQCHVFVCFDFLALNPDTPVYHITANNIQPGKHKSA